MTTLQRVIDTNATFLDTLNQILHNTGVLFELRINILLELLRGKFSITPIELREPLMKVVQTTTISKEELFQKVFMFYGSKYLKKEFDQFYTPVTIGEFLCGLCNPKKRMIDPASGTGDLAIHYMGDISLWDISKDVTDIARDNYAFQSKPATITTKDSLASSQDENATYDYAIVNPPFGTKTLVTSSDVLETYTLGKGKKKQEVGILFVERSMNLLKDSGVLFIVLPNGYFGNTSNTYVELRKYILQYRVIGIVKLPQNTFKRSGTGVSTNILIVSKTRPPTEYDIFVEEVHDIGYELNKKNTPYKYRKNNAEYAVDANGHPILQNDLPGVLERICTFASRASIPNIRPPTRSDTSYQVVRSSNLGNAHVLDISRYLKNYTNVVTNTAGKATILSLLQPSYSCGFQKDNAKEYVYLDIKEINTPLHNGKRLQGHELPSRAKYLVQQYDILVSRLKGAVGFTVILENKDNLVCTNGLCVLRPKDMASMRVLFAGLFSAEFGIQHTSLTTGSIMESISDEDIKQIMISTEIDTERFQRILDSIAVLQTELPQ
jgi:type I restriction enzyme M protein